MRRWDRTLSAGLVASLVFAVASSRAWGGQVWLKDGRILEGTPAPLSTVAEVPGAGAPGEVGPLQLIVMVDDDLRRTFVSKRQVQEYRHESSIGILERYNVREALRQPVLRSGLAVRAVGPFIAEPWSEYGRRIVRMITDRGQQNIIQCITEITPLWTKVESRTFLWDMRIDTNSIPPDKLAKILANLTDSDDIEARKKLARFYLQGEHYEEAARQLKSIQADFPDDPRSRELESSITSITQLSAQRLLRELQLRREAGQHRLVHKLLQEFPSEGVAGNVLEQVRQMRREYESLSSQYTKMLKRFDALVRKIEDSNLRERIAPIRDEIFAELNVNTLDRLATFGQLLDDDKLLPEEKVSLAISGWLLGSDSATVKLPVALSVYEVRGLVRQYLRAEDALSRAEILDRFRSQEGGTPELVAQILAHMKPPIETPTPRAGPKPPGEAPGDAPPAEGPAGTGEEADQKLPLAAAPKQGYYELQVVALPDAPPVRYLVQLPPEYDPYRRYPAIVTLHGGRTTPSLQVDWWAGAWTEAGWRNGQATRHGYIVIAPAWAAEHQKTYRYSRQEHAAVLGALRDACRRFAVDTDRVFLSGHSIGGDAAWDMGLAHPDLWAGVIPIVARSRKYCSHYWQNAKLVPFYFVAGELDGNQLTQNARDLDRYLRRGYNVTVAEYIGRGHEHFSDEIQRLFDWMSRFRRDFFPADFTVSSMRRWDNFFWWVELDDLPAARMVDPIDWPPRSPTRPLETQATLTATNGVNVRRTGAGRVTVWLSPEIVDFQKPMTITVEGRRVGPPNRSVEPSLETMLEDVRTRGDRQHPFWARVESSAGRVGVGR